MADGVCGMHYVNIRYTRQGKQEEHALRFYACTVQKQFSFAVTVIATAHHHYQLHTGKLHYVVLPAKLHCKIKNRTTIAVWRTKSLFHLA